MLDRLSKQQDQLERTNKRLLRSRAIVRRQKPSIPVLDSVLEGPCTRSEGIVRVQIETLDLKIASNEESTKGDSSPNSITNRFGTHRTTLLRAQSPKEPKSGPITVIYRSDVEQLENANSDSGGGGGESNPAQAFHDYFANKRQ